MCIPYHTKWQTNSGCVCVCVFVRSNCRSSGCSEEEGFSPPSRLVEKLETLKQTHINAGHNCIQLWCIVVSSAVYHWASRHIAIRLCDIGSPLWIIGCRNGDRLHFPAHHPLIPFSCCFRGLLAPFSAHTTTSYYCFLLFHLRYAVTSQSCVDETNLQAQATMVSAFAGRQGLELGRKGSLLQTQFQLFFHV